LPWIPNIQVLNCINSIRLTKRPSTLCLVITLYKLYRAPLASNSSILVDFIDTTQDLFLHQSPPDTEVIKLPMLVSEEGMISDVVLSDHICICIVTVKILMTDYERTVKHCRSHWLIRDY